jgi:hypothetical protein
MHSKQRSLIWLNALGGAAVLLSYAWGIGASAGLGASLWGGVPESARWIYTVNMFLAAAGYFLFTPYILFRLPPDTTLVAGRFRYGLFHVLYALVLLPSALWLPLTAHMIGEPSAAAWLAVRIDLALVALGSLGLLASLLALSPDAPRGRTWAVIGTIPFCLQTAVLDAIVWPAFFPVSVH